MVGIQKEWCVILVRRENKTECAVHKTSLSCRDMTVVLDEKRNLFPKYFLKKIYRVETELSI